MANKCFYCRTVVSDVDKVPIIVGAKTEHVCVACDDRIVSYAQDEYSYDDQAHPDV